MRDDKEMTPHLLLKRGIEGLERPSGVAKLKTLEKPEIEGDRDAEGLSSSRYIAILERFLDELEMWNRRIRLVSGERKDIVVRHLLDSLAVYPVIQDLGIREIVDVGSGNGFPAIPLALRDERLRFSLVERGQKKAVFLRNAVGILNLGERVEVLEEDVREVDRQFPLVISRAFMPLSSAVPLLRTSVGREGVLLFFAGKREKIDMELKLLEKETGIHHRPEIIPVEVPFLEEERHFCLFAGGAPNA